MITPITDKFFLGDLGEYYYLTDDPTVLCSLQNYNNFKVNGSLYTCDGILWDNVNETETTFYLYR